jgi:hypothetical protein
MLGVTRGKSTLAILLVAIMLSSLLVNLTPAPQSLDESAIRSDSGTVSYDLYFASAPGGHPTDGRITTERPDSGGQEEESASGTNVEFSTDQMLSDLIVTGTPNGNQFELEIVLFLKATGQEGSTVDWTVSVIAGTSIIGTEDWSTDVCTPSAWGGNTCGFDERYFHPSWGSPSDFTVDADDRLKVVVSADMECNSGGGNPDPPNGSDSETSGRQLPGGGTDCDAWVAWNEIDTASGRFSKIEVETQPLSGSQVKVHRPDSVWTDEEVGTEQNPWFPNDSPDMRIMQFNVELRDAFGREDIEVVRLYMTDDQGQVAFTHTFDDEELVTDNNALRGQYNWTYPGGLDSGWYELDLEVENIQGKSFTIDHPNVLMSSYGVSLTHGSDRVVEYIAPSSTTPVNLDLRHVGASGSSYALTVELAVLTNLASSWIVEFDRADQIYDLSGGGMEAHPVLLLTAPDDLSNSPDTLQIRAVAYDNASILVHQTTLQLDLEKLDTYSPPMVSLWPEEHDNQYANSTGALNIDQNIHRYVEDGVFTTFYLEIFNTGFDTDQFRIDVKQDSNANLRFWDNDTGQRIEEDEGDGTYHTSGLDRHTTQTIRLQIKPSTSRDDPDSGLIELEIISIGNSTEKASIAFTIQRTFGIQAQVVWDCDATPLGHADAEICLNNDDHISFTIEVTNTLTEGDTATDWLIVNPQNLDRNIDEQLYPDSANEKYGLWQYDLTDNNGDPTPRVQLAPGDTALVNLDVTLTSQVIEGNHTIYLRVREDIADTSIARYFDLPLSIEIGQDDPTIEIKLYSQIPVFQPGMEEEITMIVKNDGNSDVMVLLDADADGDWTASAFNSTTGAQLISVKAFTQEFFTVKIRAGEGALNNDEMSIVVTATPLSEDESYPAEYTAEMDVTIRVSINGVFGVIWKELQHPRPSTIAIGLGVVILLVAAVTGRKNRVEYIDVWVDEEEGEDESEMELPDLVSAEDDDSYDDEDIELVDFD